MSVWLSWILVWVHPGPSYCSVFVYMLLIQNVIYQGKTYQCELTMAALPGAHFLKVLKTFRTRKAVAKSWSLCLQSCFIHIFFKWTEILIIQEVSGVCTSPFLDRDELKMALRAWKVSGTFKTWAQVGYENAHWYQIKQRLTPCSGTKSVFWWLELLSTCLV